MKIGNFKVIAISATMTISMPLSALAEDDTLDWIVGCCLSPNPLTCFSGAGARALRADPDRKAELYQLETRISDMSERHVFDYAIESRSDAGIKGTKLVSSCKPNVLLDMFEKRIPVKEIRSACEIKPL